MDHPAHTHSDDSLEATETCASFFKEGDFSPRIFAGEELGLIPDDCNSILIKLTAGLKEDLNWSEAKIKAQKAVEMNLAILWEIDFGFSSPDSLPLSDTSQFLSFQIALDHFQDTLWPAFSSHSLGLALYRGSIDFSHFFKNDQEAHTRLHILHEELLSREEIVDKAHVELLFSRGLFIDYLDLLSSVLSAQIPLYLILDCSLIGDMAGLLQVISCEQFAHYRLILKTSSCQPSCLNWDTERDVISGPLKIPGSTNTGILMPASSCYRLEPFQQISEAILQLQEREINFRSIPESLLTQQWDGLDFLIVAPTGLTSTGKRMLNGFCAAGGTVVNYGFSLSLSQEVTFPEWISRQGELTLH